MGVITITPPPYEELPGSPDEDWPEAGGAFRATRTLLCAWTNRANLVLYMRGGMTGGDIVQPQDYPHQAGVKCVSAHAVPFSERVEAFGGNTNVATYSHAQVTAVYGGGGANTGSGTNSAGEPIFETLEPAVEYLQLPATGFRWGSTNGTALLPDEAPGKPFYSMVYKYKRAGVLVIPSSTFSLIGKVNDANITSYTLSGQVFDAETLLYAPPLLEHTVTADGAPSFTLNYTFFYKPDGHNRFWRNDTQAWDRIFNAAGPADPFPTGDFTTLLG